MKAFISYSDKDKEQIRPLLLKIKEQSDDNFDYFLYHDSKTLGKKTYEEIIAQIEASNVFIYFHSKNSKRSEYVQNEIGYAIAKQKLIWPLRLDKSQIKGMLQDINFIDTTSQKDIEQLKTQIKQEIASKQSQPIQRKQSIVPSTKENIPPVNFTGFGKDELQALLTIIVIIGGAYLIIKSSKG